MIQKSYHIKHSIHNHVGFDIVYQDNAMDTFRTEAVSKQSLYITSEHLTLLTETEKGNIFTQGKRFVKLF